MAKKFDRKAPWVVDSNYELKAYPSSRRKKWAPNSNDRLRLTKTKIKYCNSWFFQVWLRRLFWPKAMGLWPENGAKSRNAARVSPLGIHCQGQKTLLKTSSLMITVSKNIPKKVEVLVNFCLLQSLKSIFWKLFHRGPENFKKFRAKKLVKSNKWISQKFFFYQSPLFAISKMAKNPFLNWEKV